MFEGKLKQTAKTIVKHTILNVGHALLTHHEAPRTHKLHECDMEGSSEQLGVSCETSGCHLGPGAKPGEIGGQHTGLQNKYEPQRQA